MDKPNPNATIQLDRPSDLDAVVLDDDEVDAALVDEPRPSGPPPLPPSELAKVGMGPPPGSVAPPGSLAPPPEANRKPWLMPVVLGVGLVIAIGAGIKVGGALNAQRTGGDAPPAAPSVAPKPSAVAPPAAASASAAASAPMITVPVIEMNDPH